MEQVFYTAHSKASHYILRHTSHRFRTIIEHAVLGLAICAFCTVILSHRAFVHREDIACNDNSLLSGSSSGIINSIGDGGISIYSILVQLIRGGYTWIIQNKKSASSSSSWPSSSSDKQVPLLCLKSIPGFHEDADVNHILYLTHDMNFMNEGSGVGVGESRAFTIYRGGQHHHENERLITGFISSFDHHQSSTKKKQQQLSSSETCVIDDNSETTLKQRQQQQQQQQLTLTQRLGFSSSGQQMQQQQKHRPCPKQMITFLSHHGYLPTIEDTNQQQQPPPSSLHNQGNVTTTTTTYSPIIYSYSHSHGLLSLTPNLQHTHNVSTQFIIPSTTDANCFGEPFLKSIIFRLVGPDTVILNWILGFQHHHHHHHVVVGSNKDVSSSSSSSSRRPRFVYHWKAKKLIDLDIFDKDHYAFSSRSGGDEATSTTAKATATSKSINTMLSKLQRHPLYRLLRFLTFRLSVLLSSLFIFFLTTSLVSFTLQETQDRMLEFTLQLKDRVRNRLPLAGLIVRHVLETLVFVPIMVGMIFFLIEFYGGDKFLAFSVLSMVWLCEVFSAIR
jgi:hypothetical protein